jgi:hypothetical protein
MARATTFALLLSLAACGGGQFVPDDKVGDDDDDDDNGDDGGDDTNSPDDEDGDGYSPADGDCDDTNPDVFPGQDEVCDDIDNDCDGAVDDDPIDAATWYFDGDGDGHGDPFNTSVSCDPYTNFVELGDDCDDARAYVSPSAVEICDGIDNDCDGEFDEDVAPEDADTFYIDNDGDGYGSDAETTQACDVPSGYSSNADDCDDTDGDVHPGVPDAFEDGIDSDCDGDIDEDASCNPYRPFGNGSTATRTYATTAYDGASYTETVSIASWDAGTGVATLQRVLLSSAGSSWTVTESHACNGGATAMTGYSLSDGGLTTIAATFSLARTDLEDAASMTAGTRWAFAYDSTDAVMGVLWNVAGTMEVIGTESVTVAAGTFDALRVENNYTLTDASGSGYDRTSTNTTWWVSGLGPVMAYDVDSTGNVWEDRQLQSYTGFTP